MDPNEYQKQATRTESHKHIVLGQFDALNRMTHAAFGLCTEAGEVQDILKRIIFYKDRFNDEKRNHLVEELGDVLWYVAIACDALGVEMNDVMEANIRKLRKRFPDEFSTDDALNRDLEAEKQAIEGEQS